MKVPKRNDEVIQIRMTSSQKKHYKNEAQKFHLSLSQYIRSTLNNQQLRQSPISPEIFERFYDFRKQLESLPISKKDRRNLEDMLSHILLFLTEEEGENYHADCQIRKPDS